MRIDLTLPKSWGELTESQLLFFVAQEKRGLQRAEFLTECFLEFSGLKLVRDCGKHGAPVFEQGPYTFTIAPDEYASLCNALAWLLDTTGSPVNLKRIGLARGCHVQITDVSLEQVLLADNLLNAYVATQDRKYVAMLTACFYHKPWQRFDDTKVERRSRYFLKSDKLESVLYWYLGTKIDLKRKFPAIYEGGKGGVQTPEEIVLATLSALNGGDITKNAKIFKSPCLEALNELNNLAERAANMKK